MGHTVRLRPNHYEMLGLTPAATVEEIRRAFARELNLLPMRPFGRLAQVSVAYETLRDPAKRKAYDAGLAPKPQPKPEPRIEPGAEPVPPRIARPASTQPVHAPHPTPRPLADPLPRVPRPAPHPEPSTERRAPPFPATSPLSELAAADDYHGESPIGWKVPAIGGAAVILAIAVGAWAGLESVNDNAAAPPARMATLKVAPARPVEAIASPPAAPPVSTADVRREPRTSVAPAAAPIVRPRLTSPAEAAPEPVEAAVPDQAPPDLLAPESAAETVAAEGLAETAVAATTTKMPLPNSVIARTIGRIGYACGQVASTAAIEGAAPGVFKVTCTSGHSYRAAPVRGRYHFRRMAN